MGRLQALSLTLGFLLLNAASYTTDAQVGDGTDSNSAFPVVIRINGGLKRQLVPIWRFFGADEPNYATMKNGRKLLGELGALHPNNVYFRAHNLLTSGDGTPALKWGSTGAYDEDGNGHPIYNWRILDSIFDAYLKNGVRPYVQIGFMPKAMSIKPEPYQHSWSPDAKYDAIYTGWAYPPKDYAKWSELAFEWTKHCLQKYGADELKNWYWEVWNEPNIGYWRGTPEEFLKLHDYAIAGVRRAFPQARVGGADTAGSGGRFTRDFLQHCLRGTNFATGQTGTPLDFVSFHAKGSPTYVDGHVRMGISAQLRTIADAFRIIKSFPEVQKKPVVIGESDPEGCAACQGPSLSYRNGTMYASYTAAVFARKMELAAKNEINLEGALTWAFEFEEQPYFAGFRTLASNGIDKPVLNVFRMFSRMKGEQLSVESNHAVGLDEMLKEGVRSSPDVSALACRDERSFWIMVWHYHDDDLAGPQADVSLEVNGIPANQQEAMLKHYRIDDEHSNAFMAWKRMGSPQQPAPSQYVQLEEAGRLMELEQPRKVTIESGKASVRFKLPRQAISLVNLAW